MSTIFKKIIKGEIPCFKVAENENYLAFLDINPLHKGHTLIIPKIEVDYIFDLPDEIYIGLMTFAKKVALAIDKTITCERIGVTVIGLEVAHAHVHLIPINNVNDIDFGRKRVILSNEEFAEIAKKIAANFSE